MSLLFDGIDDRAMTASIAGIPVTYPFTLAAVVSMTAIGGGGRAVLAAGSGSSEGVGATIWRLVIQNAGQLRVALGSAGFNFNTVVLAAGEPCFIAVTCLDDSNRRGYIYRYPSRSEVGEFSATTVGIGASASPRLKLGCVTQDAADTIFANFFNGSITWAAVWDRYLGSAGDGYDQLRALAHLGPRVMGRPAFLAEFLEGQGSVVYDRSGNGNHATMANFPASPWQPVGLPGPWWTRRPRFVDRPHAPFTSLVTDVANYLAAAGIGLSPSSNLFIAPLPEVADQASVSILAYGGMPATRAFSSSLHAPVCEKWRFQVTVRSADGNGFATAELLAKTIRGKLDQIGEVTLTGTRYLNIRALSSPFTIGQDANDRHRFVCNYEAWKEREVNAA